MEDVSQREWVRPGGVGGLHGGTLTEPGVHLHGRATGGGFTGECPRAPLSPNPSSPIFAGRAPKSRRFDTHRPPPSQLIAKDASQRGATAAAEALRHAGELSDEEGYHQEERKKPSFGRLLVRAQSRTRTLTSPNSTVHRPLTPIPRPHVTVTGLARLALASAWSLLPDLPPALLPRVAALHVPHDRLVHRRRRREAANLPGALRHRRRGQRGARLLERLPVHVRAEPHRPEASIHTVRQDTRAGDWLL